MVPISKNAKQLNYPGSPPRVEKGRERWKITDAKATFSYVPNPLLKHAFLELHAKEWSQLKVANKSQQELHQKGIECLNRNDAKIAICKKSIEVITTAIKILRTCEKVVLQIGSKEKTYKSESELKELKDKIKKKIIKAESRQLEIKKLMGKVFPALVLTRTPFNKTAYKEMRKQLKASPLHPAICKMDVNKLLEVTLMPNNSETLLGEIKDDIQNNMEVDILLFSQQLVLFYKSGLVFTGHKTPSSAEAVSGKGVNNRKKGDEKISYEAVHSRRISRPVHKYKKEELVFAKGTFFFYSWNCTIILPKEVNEVDSALESSGIREASLKIFDLVASKTISPSRGVECYLKFAKRKLKALKNKDPRTAIIVKNYLKVIKSHREEIEADSKKWLEKILSQKSKEGEESKDFYIRMRDKMHKIISKEGVATL